MTVTKKIREHVLYAYMSMQRLVLREVTPEQTTKMLHTDEAFRGRWESSKILKHIYKVNLVSRMLTGPKWQSQNLSYNPILKYDEGLGTYLPIHSTVLQMSYSKTRKLTILNL